MMTEREAIKEVMKYEKKHKRSPRDVSNRKKGYDIESKNRFIEVKGFKGSLGADRALYKSIKNLNKSKYWIYLIYDINTKPKLIKISPGLIKKKGVIQLNPRKYIIYPSQLRRKYNLKSELI